MSVSGKRFISRTQSFLKMAACAGQERKASMDTDCFGLKGDNIALFDGLMSVTEGQFLKVTSLTTFVERMPVSIPTM